MLMRVAAAAVNHAHACKTDAHGFHQKFIEDETRCVKIQSMQIEVRLDGESAGPKVIQIKTAVWVDRTFDVLSCLFNLHIALAHKFFEGAQRVLFVISHHASRRQTTLRLEGRREGVPWGLVSARLQADRPRGESFPV